VLPEAQRLQGIIARCDYTLAKASIAGTKFILKKLHGYGDLPRRPLPPIDANAAEDLWNHPHIQALVGLEQEFNGKTSA
jgi:L-threo-3-deoxy-hexylosonate aldolase